MHFELRAQYGEALGHAQDRRHADAAREQQAPARAMRQREVVLRGADRQHVPRLHALVHRLRAAARIRVLEDCDHVAVALRRIVAERVLAGDAFTELDVDVRSGGERRHALSVDGDELEAADVDRLQRLGGDPDLQAAGKSVHIHLKVLGNSRRHASGRNGRAYGRGSTPSYARSSIAFTGS